MDRCEQSDIQHAVTTGSATEVSRHRIHRCRVIWWGEFRTSPSAEPAYTQSGFELVKLPTLASVVESASKGKAQCTSVGNIVR